MRARSECARAVENRSPGRGAKVRDGRFRLHNPLVQVGRRFGEGGIKVAPEPAKGPTWAAAGSHFYATSTDLGPAPDHRPEPAGLHLDAHFARDAVGNWS